MLSTDDLKIMFVKKLAEENFAKLGLGDWTLKWDNRKRRFGACYYGDKAIVMSRPMTLASTPDQIEDTFFHEVAHALTPGRGHGPEWQAMAVKLGATPKSRGKLTDEGKEKMLNNEAKWVMVFGKEVVHHYYKKPSAAIRKINTMWIRGRKRETYGKLAIIPVAQYKML